MEKEVGKQASGNSALENNAGVQLTEQGISKEELTIDDLHSDLEQKLQEQGFIFDKKKFIFSEEHMTLGERIADKVASFGGSWTFITLFGVGILSWMTLNIVFLLNKGFDPYPFILLNLVLSCLAAIQAPIIMMSQNRQALKDRRQAEINIEKDIIDFKQDRLDLILDQKEWELLNDMSERLKRVEADVHNGFFQKQKARNKGKDIAKNHKKRKK